MCIWLYGVSCLNVDGVDYICTPSCDVTFATGETTETFDITIMNNNAFEGLEHFSVTFISPDYIIIGNPSEAVILIVDIDGEFMLNT